MLTAANVLLATGNGQAAVPTVNRVIPAHTAPQAGFELSETPAAEEIRQVRLFAEPLIPTGAALSAAQNAEVARALRAHAKRTVMDDFSAIERYVAQYPDSAWTPSLLFNLGMEYYRTGWYSKALEAWEKAWPLLKPATEPAAKALGDRAAGELALMYGRIGRMGDLSALLDSIKGRVIVGSAEQKISGAKEGLWAMQNRPEVAFRCGPMALDRINAHNDPQKVANPLIRDSKSTTNGFSLDQVAELSKQLGMNYQMAYRTAGAPVLMPAVVNWKVGHYAALIREEGGLYLVQDPTFQNDAWVSGRALEAETTGYFLVPSGKLPAGWRTVSADEGRNVWGKGQIYLLDLTATTPHDKCLPCWLSRLLSQLTGHPAGMAAATVSLMLVSLKLEDDPVGYTPPVGPSVRFIATYNQYESGQPANFSYCNLGQKWTFNWLEFISDNPSIPSADVGYYTDGGGTLTYTLYNVLSKSFAPETKSQTVLTRTATNSYSLLFPDGSLHIFSQPTGLIGARKVFLTQVMDPQGNSVQISYDNQFRVVALTDAIGQVTVFSYTDASDPLKITQVTDPFGRTATFLYNTNGLLSQITDCIGLTSRFTYDSGTFIRALTTPYGTTSFAYANTNNAWGPNKWLVTTYPDGEKERVEFTESPNVGIAMTDPTTNVPSGMPTFDNYLDYRNTYFWDRNAYSAYAANTNDYTTARLYHWLHSADGQSAVGVPESEKEPLENRVWYGYAGQTAPQYVGASSQPTFVGRVLDDGTTQLRMYAYNALGHVINSIDPIGRTMTYVYSNNLVDLLEVHQTTGTNNDLLYRATYNSQHLPVATFDAAGQMTTNTYNTRGQVLATTDAQGHTTTFTYDTNGYLLTIVGPLGGTNDTISFGYDPVGRVQSVTNTDGYTLTSSYDNMDRPSNISYPDGTFEAFTYSNLDLVLNQDRLGRRSAQTYDSMRRLIATEDPLGRVTHLEYCGCGSLSGLIDPMGRKTSWEHDVQGRLTAKVCADGSRTSYAYENTTSRTKSVTDELGQLKMCDYHLDDNLRTVSYPNAQNFTPTVTYDYDAAYDRLVAIHDGIGVTTMSYNPAGVFGALLISSVTGPWPNEMVACQYDQIGRMTNRTINGVAQTFTFDSLGRATNVVNALGSFGYNYDGATARVLDAFYPNGQVSHYSYLNNSGDRRLQQIAHQKSNAALISAFTYAYDPVGNITNWVQQLGAVTQTWSIGYDPADQLLRVTESGANPVNYGYDYDAAANRLSETTNGVRRSFAYNTLNQLTSASATNAASIVYQWDAEERLTAIIQGTNQSQFFYDGLGRRARIMELSGGVIQADRRFVWFGTEICEEWNSNNVVVNRYFDQGEQQSGTNLYYTQDHLGSTRELTDSAAEVRAEYAYAPYGSPFKLNGNLEANFGFTGHFRHLPSGLHLTAFRAYDGSKARWLSRDPVSIGAGQSSLYAYANNDPIGLVDPDGAEPAPAGLYFAQPTLIHMPSDTPLEKRQAPQGSYILVKGIVYFDKDRRWVPGKNTTIGQFRRIGDEIRGYSVSTAGGSKIPQETRTGGKIVAKFDCHSGLWIEKTSTGLRFIISTLDDKIGVLLQPVEFQNMRFLAPARSRPKEIRDVHMTTTSKKN